MARKKKNTRQSTKIASAARRSKRQKAKAAKRKREHARAEARPTPSPTVTRRKPAQASPPIPWEPPPHQVALHPAVLSPEGPQPPAFETLPGPGPSVLAAKFGERGFALYQRHESGACVPVSPLDLPLHTEVSWAGEPFDVLEARPHRVRWESGPVWRKDRIVGALVVHDLVLEEWGLEWAPVVPVTIVEDTFEGKKWRVEVGQGLADGYLDAQGIDWWGGSDGSHSYAVVEFLDSQARRLWARVLRAEASEPVEVQAEADPQQLVEAIKGPSPKYKRAAIDALVAHQEAVIPGLLTMLDEILAGPPGGDERDELEFGGIYALVLLTHFRCTEAHDRLVALGRRLPADAFEEAFGDFLTEGFDAALLRTCGEDCSKIRELLLDRNADEYLRSQAAKALAGAVVLGDADRGEVLELLASLLIPEAAEQGSYLWSGVGSAMLHLYPVEYQDRLVQACHEWLIEPIHFDAEHIVELIAKGPAHAVEGLHCVEEPGWQDIHAKLEWWACFDG
jgi:hypothetical protein